MPKGVKDGEQGKVDTREREECAREPEGTSENSKRKRVLAYKSKGYTKKQGRRQGCAREPKGALEMLTHIDSFTDVVTRSTSFVIFSYDKRKL